jgi:cysteine-rich repeat protein
MNVPWNVRAALLSAGLFTVCALTTAPEVGAVDKIVLGKKVNISNPNATARTFLGLGKEQPTDVGQAGQPGLDPGNDPIANGATLTTLAIGTTSSQETFNLPAGAFVNADNPGWKQTNTGYLYKDPKRLNGPVKVVVLKRTPADLFLVKAKIVGTDPGTGPLDIGTAPPNTGDEAGMILSINNGDSYCVRWGGPAGGNEKQDHATKYLVVSDNTAQTSEAGCPDALPTTTSSSTSSSTSTIASTTTTTVASTTTTTAASTTTTTAPTTTTTAASTTTTTAASTTTTTFHPLCGNGVLNGAAGETCDDGNHSDNDACPADCRVDACTPVTGTQRNFDIFFTPNTGVNVGGITVLMDYPEGKVEIQGPPHPSGTFSMIPPGSTPIVQDWNHSLRVTVAIGGGNPLPPGRLIRVRFRDCTGATPPTPANFGCTVLEATDPLSNPVTNEVTCTVVQP